MKKSTNVCRYCLVKSMEPADDLGKGWLKCSNCGATEFPNPTTVRQGDLVAVPPENAYDPPGMRPRKRKSAKTAGRS